MNAIDISTFNIPDMVVATIAILLGIRGLVRGLSGELAHLTSSALMTALFIFAFTPATDYVCGTYELSLWPARFSVMAIILLATLGSFFLCSFIFKGLIQMGLSAPGDKVAGLIGGVFHGLLVMCVVLVLAHSIPHEGFSQRVYVQSYSGRFVDQHVMPIAERYIPEKIEIPAGITLPEELPELLND